MRDPGIYVYWLVEEGALAVAPHVPGIDGAHAVELVCHDGVCALISRVDLDQFDEQPLREHLSDMAWVEQTAQHHQQVLDAVLDQCTPIPMRMCTVYAREAGLRSMLAGQHDILLDGLRELDAKLEWGVKALARPRAGGGPDRSDRVTPPASEPAAATGTAYLQSRLAQRNKDAHRQADLDQACEEVHGELCAVAAAARLSAPQRPEVSGFDAAMVMNASYLVANVRHDEFRERLAALADEVAPQGLELVLTGPWPPYNFVPAAIGGGL